MGTIRLHGLGLMAGWAGWLLDRAQLRTAAGLGLVFTWYLRRQQRLDLAKLDERGLKDIGLSRADVAREVGKPFWR